MNILDENVLEDQRQSMDMKEAQTWNCDKRRSSSTVYTARS